MTHKGGVHDSVRIQVIDRGQADGIVIRTPNTNWIVIDAGTNAQQADAMRDAWGVEEVALVAALGCNSYNVSHLNPVL